MASTKEVEDFLEHFGTKGMRWGVRRDRTGHLKTGTVKRVMTNTSMQTKRGIVTKNAPDYYDELFAGRKSKALVKTYKAARGPINKGTKILNKDPRFKGQDFKKDSPLRREYYKEFSKMAETQLNAASVLKGNNKFGEYRLNFSYDHDKSAYPEVTVKLNSNIAGRVEERAAAKATRKTVGGLKQSDNSSAYLEHEDDPEIKLEIEWDETGYILGLKDLPDLKQSADSMDAALNFLEHHGVKGMKWGVRKPVSSAGRKPNRPSAPKAKPKEKAKEGPKPDHHTLSNEEMQRVINRINLESQYKRATTPVTFKSKAKEMLMTAGKQAIQSKMNDIAKNTADLALRSTLNAAIGKEMTTTLLGKKKDKKDEDKKDD